MALTKSVVNIQEWTTVGQAVVGVSSVYSNAGNYESILHIQGFLDSTVAHIGTEFLVQVSAATAGNEDWQNLTNFTELPYTADFFALTAAVAAAATICYGNVPATFTVADKVIHYVGIKDGVLADSEMALQKTYGASTSVGFVDGLTNAHSSGVNVWSQAFVKDISIPGAVNRVRVIVNNDYDSNGASLMYKVRVSEVTAI